MNRRGFLAGILAAGAAPAVVKAASLMKVSGIVLPTDEEVLTYAEYPWQQMGLGFSVQREALGKAFTELLATTFRNAKAEIMADVIEHNRLLLYASTH